MPYMQHTLEQYSWYFSSRLPTQWMIATLFGSSPFFNNTLPVVGPAELTMRSNSRLVITLSNLPYPYSLMGDGSNNLKPVVRMMLPTSISSISSSCWKFMAFLSQNFSQARHLPFRK